MTEETEDGSDDEEQTYDLVIPDVTPEQASLISAGVSEAALTAARAGREDHLDAILQAQKDLMMENREVMKTALVEYDWVRMAELDSETAEALGIEVGPEGIVRDADDFEDIEID